MTISQRIFSIMEQKNIKPSFIADSLGINRSVVSAWKNRNSSPPAELIMQICKLLGVSVEFLLTGTEPLYSMPKTLSLGTKQLLNVTDFMSEADRLLLAGAILQSIRDHGEFDAASFLAPPSMATKKGREKRTSSLAFSAVARGGGRMEGELTPEEAAAEAAQPSDDLDL